jgi:hypothetical protein
VITFFIVWGITLVIAIVGYWRVYNWLNAAVLKMRGWSATLKLSKQTGAVAIGNVIDGLVVIFLGITLVYQFVPQIEEQADTSNITNPTTKSFGDTGSWLLPSIAIIGLIYLGIRLFLAFGKRRG